MKTSRLTRRLLAGGPLILSILAGCLSTGDDDDDSSATPTPTATPEGLPEGCDVAVAPGADDYTAVQTAFIEAPEGSTICLTAGRYSFNRSLSITTNRITVRGIGNPELDFSQQGDDGSGANGLVATGDDFTIEDLTVLNPAGDGIRATEVKNVTYRNVAVIWENGPDSDNGAYGLYPVSSQGVIIEGCLVSGASDAGIYVGQSTDILVIDSEVYGNVAGIEIENSTDAEVTRNHAHDHTGGILVFNLPGLPVQDGKRAKVHENLIEHNNEPNFAPEGNIVGLVPGGTGVMVLASDDNEFHDNTIIENISVGIAILSYSKQLVGEFEDENFDPYPEGNYVHDNIFYDNGTDPQGRDLKALMVAGGVEPPIAPLVWDGCEGAEKDNTDGALTNCFYANVDGQGGAVTYLNMGICNDLETSDDMTEVTCEHDPLPTLE